MYRDDRDALLARADALQKELDDAEREGAEQREELSDANEKLAAQQKELAALKKRLAKLEKSDDPQEIKRRAIVAKMVIAGVLVVGAAAAAAVVLLSKGGADEETGGQPSAAVSAGEPDAAPPPACDRLQVEATVSTVLAPIHKCYLMYTPDFTGSVDARWRIGADGQASDVDIAESVDAYLRQCIHDELIGPTFGATDCLAKRTFRFEASCPPPRQCRPGETRPVCCADYDLPERPPADAITAALRPQLPYVQACAKRHEAPDAVTVSLRIEPSGRLGPISSSTSTTSSRISIQGSGSIEISGDSKVTIDGEPIENTALANVSLMSCISNALMPARFPLSQKGATVTQTFSFNAE